MNGEVHPTSHLQLLSVSSLSQHLVKKAWRSESFPPQGGMNIQVPRVLPRPLNTNFLMSLHHLYASLGGDGTGGQLENQEFPHIGMGKAPLRTPVCGPALQG